MPSRIDDTRTQRAISTPLAFAGLALLVLAIAVIVVTSTGAGDDERAVDTSGLLVEATPTPLPNMEPVATTPPVQDPGPVAVPAPTPLVLPLPTPEFGPTGRPSSAGSVWVLSAKPEIGRPTVFDGPGGKEIPVTYTYLDGRIDPSYDHFTNPTYFGNPLSLMVVEGKRGDDWAEVQIPTRPIMTGWIRTDGFSWSTSDYYVQVNLGNNTIKVWRGDALIVDGEAVVTGDAGRETPVASTYIDEIMPGPSGAYGPWLLSLGVFSDAINTFGSAGGLPKVALHGTNRPDLLGQYASNGCIRLPNEVISTLAQEIPVGTRVDIVRMG